MWDYLFIEVFMEVYFCVQLESKSGEGEGVKLVHDCSRMIALYIVSSEAISTYTYIVDKKKLGTAHGG